MVTLVGGSLERTQSSDVETLEKWVVL